MAKKTKPTPAPEPELQPEPAPIIPEPPVEPSPPEPVPAAEPATPTPMIVPKRATPKPDLPLQDVIFVSETSLHLKFNAKIVSLDASGHARLQIAGGGRAGQIVDKVVHDPTAQALRSWHKQSV